MSVVDEYIKEIDMPEIVLKAIKGEEVELPEGVEDKELYLKEKIDAYKSKRLEFVEAKHLAPRAAKIKEDAEAKNKESYIALMNTMKGRATKLFGVEFDDGDDHKSMLDKINDAKSKLVSEASKTVNPDTENFTSTINEQNAVITELNKKLIAVDDDWKVKYEKGISEKAEEVNQLMVSKLYSERYRALEPKMAAKNLQKALRNELRTCGYKEIAYVPEGAIEPMYNIVALDGTKAMDLSKSKHVDSPDELLWEIIVKNGWDKKNNNDQSSSSSASATAEKKYKGASEVGVFFGV